jgi:hypothetical protein
MDAHTLLRAQRAGSRPVKPFIAVRKDGIWTVTQHGKSQSHRTFYGAYVRLVSSRLVSIPSSIGSLNTLIEGLGGTHVRTSF